MFKQFFFAASFISVGLFMTGCTTGDTNPNTKRPSTLHPAPPTARDFELDFLHRMSDQLQTEIVMAQLAEQHAEHHELRDVATTTVNDTSTELRQVKHWSFRWYGWVLWPRMTDEAKPIVMQIKNEPSDQFDREFLQAMIKRYSGSIEMARPMITQAPHPDARTFAETIVNDRTAKINKMTAMLREWYSVTPAPTLPGA
jgi:uncharacterized protein (DUF305 family)